jgi:hypothetical protein
MPFLPLFSFAGDCGFWMRSVKPDDDAERSGGCHPPRQPINASIDDRRRLIPNDSVTRQTLPVPARQLTVLRDDETMPLCNHSGGTQ